MEKRVPVVSVTERGEGLSRRGGADNCLLRFIEVLERLDSEEGEAASFASNPTSYLEDAGIKGLLCEVDDQTVPVSRIIEAADEKVRVPVARALARRMGYIASNAEGGPAEPRTIPFVNAIFNVNTLANMNALVNANIGVSANAMSVTLANENTRTNINGIRRQARTNGYYKIRLDTKYYSSSGFIALDGMGYSPLRQEALLARALRAQEHHSGFSAAGERSIDFRCGELHLSAIYERTDGCFVVNSAHLVEKGKRAAS
ncbi:MAG: hypothetical protein Q4B77_05995 [Coriobacteriaceae bacterium]|nr:hypothetical protein [Coriobacteriaceae bacterium]